MNAYLIILGISLHALMWEHLPEWGTWFNRWLGACPKPIQNLYHQWHCPYCAGFWIALALHAVTGHWVFPAMADMPAMWGAAALPVGWLFDALAAAILIKTGRLALHALSWPALKGYQAKAEFMQSSDPS